jgi:hypothetical protein
MTGVERSIHPARKFEGNPVLWPREEWEGKVALVYGSVIREGGKYRMWYHSGPGVSYAESDDGIHWRRPGLGIVEVDRHPTNVVINRHAAEGEPGHIPYYYELFGVTCDDRDPNASRRYKMGFLSIQREYSGPREDPFHRGSRRGLGVATSPDGIHWTLVDSWASEAICDGGTHWMFDPARKTFVLYGRTKHISPDVAKAWADDEWVQRHHWGRAVARIESPDFVNWNTTEPAAAPVVMAADVHDPPGTEIYSMSVFPYESVYIGLVQVFHNRPGECYLDVQLAVSHDSFEFTRVGDRSPFIPVGNIGTWDRFNNSIANNPPIAVGDELRFYYSGRTYRHSPYEGPDRGESGGGIGFATIQRDRFVSLCASFDGGTITTKPLALAGSTLHLNVKSDFGTIVVRVNDARGKLVAESRPIRQDRLDIPVEWAEGDLSDATGPVVLEIELANAHLYALWCTGSRPSPE